VPKIRAEGMSAVLKDPTRWGALGLTVVLICIAIHVQDVLKDNGRKEGASTYLSCL